MSFVPNPSFEHDLATSAGVRETLRLGAEQARPVAEGFTHHAMPRPGHKRMEVEVVGGEVYLVNTNFGAHLEEWGGADVKSPIYSPLRRGVRAAGFHLLAED